MYKASWKTLKSFSDTLFNFFSVNNLLCIRLLWHNLLWTKMQQQLQINWTMVQELRMDGELNNYSKYLVWELCVCVCVCMFSLSSRTCSISLGAFCKCVHHNRCKSWVFFFLSSAPLAMFPLFTPELLVPAGVCGFVSRGTAAGVWISLTKCSNGTYLV